MAKLPRPDVPASFRLVSENLQTKSSTMGPNLQRAMKMTDFSHFR